MKRAEHRPAPSQQFGCARNSAPAHSHGLLQAIGFRVASRLSALMSRPSIDSQLCGMVRQSRPKIFELEPSMALDMALDNHSSNFLRSANERGDLFKGSGPNLIRF